MTEAIQVEAVKAAPARKPRVRSGRTHPVPQQSSISTEPSAEQRLGQLASVSFTPSEPPQQVAYPEAVRRQRATTARGRRATAPRNGPVESRNVLDELPESLRRLVLRTGDTRRVRQFRTATGGHGIEMDPATARSLSLLP